MTTVEDFRTKRICPRCRYTIDPGWYHEEMVQPEGSNVFVCTLKRTQAILRGPLVDVLSAYLDEHSQTAPSPIEDVPPNDALGPEGTR